MDHKNKNIEGLERRNFNTSEIRVDNKENREIVGYASVFTDADGNIAMSENLGGFREVIHRNAFDDCIADKNLDCRMLINHNPDLLLARTPNTLSLSVDDRGLKFNFEVPSTSYGDDLMISLDRGDINQNSFGFIVEEDSWDQAEDGTTIRTINKISRLLDCSVVPYPAYPDATVAQRGFMNYRTELEKKETEKEEKDLIKRNILERKLELLKIKNKD